jgi:hypothetical protein
VITPKKTANRRCELRRADGCTIRRTAFSIFLVKNRRYIGKSQSKRPPNRNAAYPGHLGSEDERGLFPLDPKLALVIAQEVPKVDVKEPALCGASGGYAGKVE